MLNILANSLYTDREIFLRELISNASDALHRIQFEMLTNRDVLDPDAELAIHIDVDEDAHTLTVSDTGVGMTRQELVDNLGTIAHSGVTAFLEGIEEGKRPADIIGQFGVGFYSVFTVAEEVTEGGSERDLQRLRRLQGEDAELPPMILEVNRRHPLIRNLAERIANRSEDGLVKPTIEQLFDNLLLEGLHPNPARMVPRIQTLIEAAV